MAGNQSPAETDHAAFPAALEGITAFIAERFNALPSLPPTSNPATISSTLASIPTSLPARGLGLESTVPHLLQTVLPSLPQAHSGPRNFSLITGGTTPAAQLADMLSTSIDENLFVHFPENSASVALEQRTLEMVLDLLDLPRAGFRGRTMTTGATASNVLGMACARDHLYSRLPGMPTDYSFARDGPPYLPNLPHPAIVLLTLRPHFSLTKAAGLVGLGSGPRSVQTIPHAKGDDSSFDLVALEERLKKEKEAGRGVLICYDLGEVNTGSLGVGLRKIAELSREYGAWLHVDAAFGGFARLVPEYATATDGLELVDSIALDGHKWLNVPYDCGIFFTRHVSSLTSVFAPASAPAYMATGAAPVTSAAGSRSGVDCVLPQDIPAPSYVNIENSRRNRALPLYASLMSLGREGYREIFERDIAFAQQVAKYIDSSPQYELLNPTSPYAWPASGTSSRPIVPLNIVLLRGSPSSPFPPDDPSSGARLTQAINASGKMFVSGSSWEGKGAVRIAVCNWMTGLDGSRDIDLVTRVLGDVARGDAIAQA